MIDHSELKRHVAELERLARWAERIQSGKLAYSVAEAAAATGISKSTINRLIATGELKSVKTTGRRIITHRQLTEFLAELERVTS